MSHTPGPWDTTGLAVTNAGGAAVMVGSGDDRRRICEVDCQAPHKRGDGWKTECEQRRANARLIAAAPDLLAALQVAIEMLGRGEAILPQDRAQAITQAVGAVKKARGQ